MSPLNSIIASITMSSLVKITSSIPVRALSFVTENWMITVYNCTEPLKITVHYCTVHNYCTLLYIVHNYTLMITLDSS